MSKKTVTAQHDTGAFLPTSAHEMQCRGWDELDVLFVTGDAYIDHPAFGVPLLARVLEARGWRVGIIPQPDWRDPAAFQVMGRPRLCVAISSGAMDSMVNHYTAAKKVRNDDAYTPGGRAGARPDRATIAYTAAVKGAFKGVPVIIGGIEASLRRLAHYDYWNDRVRRSVLVDAKADLLVYGMAEKSLVEVVTLLDAGKRIEAITRVAGTVWMSPVPVSGIQLPEFSALEKDKALYAAAFAQASQAGTKRLVQKHGQRYVVVNPSPLPMESRDLDAVYALPFTRLPHPGYTEVIPAFEQIRWSVTSHRGCQGGCAFCAISAHQGRMIQSRSVESVVAEVRSMAASPLFRGTISDVGGPTANMYGTRVVDASRCASCRRDSCVYPQLCSNVDPDDTLATQLLRAVRRVDGVKHAYVASGVRYDLLRLQPHYCRELFTHHIGGLLKVAPESLSPELLQHMRKPGPDLFEEFLARFYAAQRELGRRCAVVPYLMAGHPGSTLEDMLKTALLLRRHGLEVEQVQEFTPTPGTLATCMYYTGIDPFRNKRIDTVKDPYQRRLQKALLLAHQPQQQKYVREALRLCGRADLFAEVSGGRALHKKKSRSATGGKRLEASAEKTGKSRAKPDGRGTPAAETTDKIRKRRRGGKRRH